MAKKRRLLLAKHPVRIEGSKVQFAKDDKGKLPSFSMLAYTGAAISQWWSDVPIVVDLESLRIPTGAMAILHDHCTWEKVGHTTSIKNDGKSIHIDGVISCTTDAAKDVAESGKNDFPWQASIGCENGSIEQHREEGTVTVNGQVHQCPIDVYRDGDLYETSFVVFGADANTSASVKAKRKGNVMPKFMERFLAKLTGTKSGLKLVQAAAKAAEDEDDDRDDPEATGDDTDDEDDPEASDDDDDDDGDPEAEDDDEEKKTESKKSKASKSAKASGSYRSLQAKETLRIAGIRKVCNGQYPKLEAAAIREGWTKDKTELAVLKAEKERSSRPSPPNVMQGARSSGGPNRNNVIAASALLSMGKDEKFVGSQFSEAEMNEAVAAQNRSYSLNRIVAECIRDAASEASVHIPSAEGVTGNGMWNHYVNAQRLLAGSSSFSTISLPGILSNIANKSLLDAYEAIPRIFRTIARKASSTDFKPAFSYRLILNGDKMEVIPATGKIPSTDLDEQAYERGIDTRGSLLTLTRKMIINDDLNAFSRIPELFGELGATTIESLGFGYLKSKRSSIFNTANKNLVSTKKALNFDGLSEATTLLASQTDKKGKPIHIRGKYLLTPPTLETAAWTLINSTHVNQSTQNPTGDKNRWHGLYEPLMSPYLGADQGKGAEAGSDDGWYLIAQPTRVALFVVSYLDGREQPIIENETAAFDVLGVQFRIYHDFGINVEDPKAATYSPGE